MENIPNKEQTVAELYELMLAARARDMFGTQDKIAKKAKELTTKYGKERYGYALYNLLVSNSVNETVYPINHFDFPGEDSVADFIRTL